MELSWKPDYSHAHIKTPPETSLTPETAFDAYQKLKKFLGRRSRSLCPADGWPANHAKDFHRHLFQFNGFHHPTRWMPKLEKGWQRLSYAEFCGWYGLLR